MKGRKGLFVKDLDYELSLRQLFWLNISKILISIVHYFYSLP
jgi:hypothetical protein